jgi:hypothetical protein
MAQDSLNEFQLKLEEQTKILQECQQKKEIDSCLKCDMVIGCEVRKEYVKASYESMNKGGGGGFDFN